MDELLRQLRELLDRFTAWAQRTGNEVARRISDRANRPRSERAAADRGDTPRRRSAGRRQQGGAPSGDFDVIVVEADDDVASVVGRIDTAEAAEIVLVVRRDARALRRANAWPHIAAHVRRYGIGLGVVSSRSDVRSHARANGLRAARTRDGLRPRGYVLHVGDRDVTVPPVPWGGVIRLAIVLAALGAIFFVGCYRVPSATVTIVPASEPFTVTGEARPNAVVDSNDLSTETMLVGTVRRQVFTVVTTTTSGETEVGEARATLSVEFANSGAAIAPVPLGTRLVTEEGITFLTDQNLDVPAQSSASVTATAELPGTDGNIAANTLTLDSEVPATVTLASSTAGVGGTNVLAPAVSQEDVDRVRAIAGDVLDRVALRTLEQIVDEEDLGTLIPSSVSAAIFSEQPVQLLDEAADVFVVEYVITASGLVVSEEEAAAYGELMILDQLPEGQALLPGSVTTEITPPAEQGGPLTINATGQVATLEEIATTASQITGMRREAARDLLQEELQLPSAPSIEISPTFIPWLWLPRRAENIELVIGSPAEAEAEAEDGASGEGDAEDGDAESTETATPTPTSEAAAN